MDKIGVRNLRSLANVNSIKICPITVLVGKNSSGKSTFLRVFPLLKQSIETKTSVPILWYGDYVDFGDFNESKNRNADENSIGLSFEFVMPIENYDQFGLRRFKVWSKEELKLKIDIELNEKFIQRLKVKLGDQDILFIFKEEGYIGKLIINNQEIKTKDLRWVSRSNSIIPEISYTTNDKNITYEDQFINKLMEKAHGSTRKETVEDISSNISLGNISDVYSSMLVSDFPNFLKENLKKIDKDEFLLINNLLVASKIDDILELCNSQIMNSLSSVKYIKPVRANADRYYRIQGLFIDEIDASGNNIPMFLHNLSAAEKIDFEQWSKETFGLVFSTLSKGGHVSLIMKDSNMGESFNLADTGYGFSQILPIIVLLWLSRRKKQPMYLRKYFGLTTGNLIIIEQPELHLHPAFQAKLIDVFAKIVTEANTVGIKNRIIFETHSETMINRLAYLISKGLLGKEDVNVLIFDKKENHSTNIKSVAFSDKGSIKEWPIGFFAPERL